ncbi:hypothetical protein MJT46_001008 [Ovis ammon polii x Ovis aries]|nr:hypothetical protein MJT46_001008 [Ovis ammon polii x Ovis aries]
MLSQLPSQGEVVQQPQEGNISGCEESSQVYCRLKCGEASSVSMMGFEEKMKSNASGCKHQNHVKSDLFLFGDYNWVKDGEASSVSMTRFEEKMKVELWSWLPSQGEVVQQPQEGNISGCEESSQVYCRLKCGEASSVSMMGFEEKMKSNARGCKHQNHVKSDLFLFGDYNWVKDGEASSVSMTRFEEKMKVELWSWLPSQGEVVQQPQEGNISGCEESSQVYCRLKCGEASSVSMMGFEEKMKVELWS